MTQSLDTSNKIINDFQIQINNYVNDIKPNGRNWINNEQLYTPTEKGGLGMIRLNDFYDAIKVSWIRCYAIDMIDDHWAEMIDTHYALTPDPDIKS